MDKHQGNRTGDHSYAASWKDTAGARRILGLDKIEIKNWVDRHNRKQARLAAGLAPKQRGRPHKGTVTSQVEYEYEINRLKMENELLRNFLQSTGRR